MSKMKIELCNEPRTCCPVKVELEGEEYHIVKANRDGTYQLLLYTGKDYRLYKRVVITAFDSWDDDEGVWCKLATKELWDSWGRDLPEKAIGDGLQESEDE